MRFGAVLALVLVFCSFSFSTTAFVQQVTVSGAGNSIDNAFVTQPATGHTLIAIVSHPASVEVTDIAADDGDSHLNKISWVYVSGAIVETWKVNNCVGTSQDFHVGLTGSTTDAVAVTFTEWSQN